MLRAFQLCKHTGCYQLADKGYCSKHKPEPYKRDMTHQRMYDKRWQKAREAYLIDNPWCEDCMSEDMYTAATEVHHKIKHNGDYNIFWDKSNWVGLCKSCHSKLTSKGG